MCVCFSFSRKGCQLTDLAVGEKNNAGPNCGSWQLTRLPFWPHFCQKIRLGTCKLFIISQWWYLMAHAKSYATLTANVCYVCEPKKRFFLLSADGRLVVHFLVFFGLAAWAKVQEKPFAITLTYGYSVFKELSLLWGNISRDLQENAVVCIDG